MAIEIREYVGHHFKSTGDYQKTNYNGKLDMKESSCMSAPLSKKSIIQIIEGIHAGPTRNYTWYMPEALKDSIPSWISPYRRPLIMHHNEEDGKIIGRVIDVDYKETNTRSGTPALVFTCNVPDKDGIEQIKDGRLETTSIGVIAHDVRCSICGRQVEIDEEGYVVCGHEKGGFYEGETCYWKIYKMEAKELSYVIVPSDIYAHNIKTMGVEEYKPGHSFSEHLKKEGAINMSESAKQAIQEGKVKEQTIENGEGLENAQKDPAAVEGAKEPKEGEGQADPVEGEPKEKDPENDPKETEPKEETLLEKIKKLEEEKAEALKKVEEIEAKLANASKAIEDKEDIIKEKELLISEEVALREAAENALVSVKAELRESLEKEFNSLREQLNKEVVLKEELTKRSDESIRDAIRDLREDLSGINNVKNIKEATDPTIGEKKDSKKSEITVKEKKTVSNINVREGMEKLMSSAIGARYF